MNFLSEVMATAGKIEMDELRYKIRRIKEDISTLKSKVNDIVKREYVQFIPLVEDDEDLTLEAIHLADEMESLSNRIDKQMKVEVTECLTEVANLSEAFRESNLLLEALQKLLFIHDNLQSTRDIHDNESRTKAIKKLIGISELLDTMSDQFESLEILEGIRAEIDEQWQSFLLSDNEALRKHITWDEREPSCKNRQLTLTVSENFAKSEILEALNLLDDLPLVTSKFCEGLMSKILIPLMTQPHSVDIMTTKGAQLILRSIPSTVDQPIQLKMENLLKVFQFLSEYLSVPIDETRKFTSKVDDFIAENFCELFIKHCVVDSIPFKQKDYRNYEKFVCQIMSFETSLRKMGFLSHKTTALSHFTSNSEEQFSENASQVHIAKARDLMKKDLHRMTQVAPSNVSNESIADNWHMDLCENTFEFPTCCISQSATELVGALTEIMEDIVHSTSTLHAVKLFCAARNIVSMYADVVSVYHAKMLTSIPQQAALFFNNCFYLAHKSVFLIVEYKPKFPQTLDARLVTMVDLVQPLRKAGLTVLIEQVQTQKKQIVDIIKDSGLITLGDTSVFPVSIEKSMRQCLRQLKLLQSVWTHILPASTYTKIMGQISSTLVEELINCILSIDDIASDVATNLVTIFQNIIEDLPRLFPNPQEVFRLIRKWGRFVELTKVLGGTLQEIDERWADGKGPLAEEFKADQVRHLIRALFRDTERRANLLARIQIQINTRGADPFSLKKRSAK
ncbi:unnamed protein product [Bemisia tabaci]|uniref:Centromere/kinetochore protein zw10 n=1 Tax=Bemisia tabaci TaxID=7038 RepID=A0A9P0F2G5_BEMTA|nr:unnamed protein product [Bemisia tabaci]